MIRKLQDFADSPYERPDEPLADTLVVGSQSGEAETVVSTPSLRTRRNVFVLGTFAFTIGAMIILFNSPYRNDFLAPGPLSSVHANILNGKGADRCAACHDAGDASLISWVQDTFSGGKHLTKCQSELCMECHNQSLDPEFALNPHGMDRIKLAELTAAQRSSGNHSVSLDTGMIFSPPINGEGEIACSACHREHHGAMVSLSALTDQQCQSCHENTFHRFEIDHPEFTNWPQVRRDRIAFDHVTHFGKHFPANQTKFDCNQCHVDDGYQNVKLLASYEATCAACHNQQVVDSTQKGMKFFALPMIDTEAITEANLNVGQWPESATGDFDGVIPPLMRLLLCADPGAAKRLEALGSDFEFSDIDPTDKQQVTEAVALVWDVKKLLYDLSLQGNEAIRLRLETSSGKKLSLADVEKLTLGLNQAVFQDAVKRWIPNLMTEVPLRQQGIDDRSVSWMPSPSDVLFQIAVQDDDELAPNPLSGLLGKPATNDDINQRAVVRTPRTLPEPSIGRKQSSEEANKPKKVVNRFLDDENNPDVLAANPLQKLLTGRPVDLPQVPDIVQVPSNTNPPDAGVGGAELPANPQNSDASPVSENFVPIQAPVVLAVNSNSGWIRDDLNLSIAYRPIGHADSFVVRWTDLVTSLPNADRNHVTKGLFGQLTSPTLGIGLCSSCHTVDQKPDDSFVMNWRTQYRDPSVRAFTKFSHGPHLIQQSCSECHEMDLSSNKVEQFASFNALTIQSNFLPITKMKCAQCHARGQADSSCTLCHSYHVGSKVMASPKK